MVSLARAELAREGFEVLPAASGVEGLGLLREQPMDVVVTDLRMQDVDGMEILRSAADARQPGSKRAWNCSFKNRVRPSLPKSARATGNRCMRSRTVGSAIQGPSCPLRVPGPPTWIVVWSEVAM
jgi:CheY-like chemotaxis protein